MKTLLYIEEKDYVRDNFLRMINGVGFFNAMTAANVREAIDIARQFRADIIITGRQITAGDMDILDVYLQDKPDIKLVVMAARKSKFAQILKAYEYKIQFEMPADPTLLLQTLLDEFETDSGGQLRGISLTSFLQMIELEEKSCEIKVMGAGQTGHLYCVSGNLIDAQMGDLKRKEAAFAILELENPLIHIDYQRPDRERTIAEPLMSLLLESGRKRDEQPLRPREKRRYRRYACTLPVKYCCEDKVEKGVIRNISLGGVFLLPRRPIPVGAQIQVALFSPSLEKGAKFAGQVVRAEGEGIGIEFAPRSLKQSGILRTVIIESQATRQNDAD